MNQRRSALPRRLHAYARSHDVDMPKRHAEHEQQRRSFTLGQPNGRAFSAFSSLPFPLCTGERTASRVAWFTQMGRQPAASALLQVVAGDCV